MGLNPPKGLHTDPEVQALTGLFERTRDLFSAGMVRHADLRTTVMKEADYTHRFLEMSGMQHQTGPHGETLGSLRSRGVREKCEQESLMCIFGGETGEVG